MTICQGERVKLSHTAIIKVKAQPLDSLARSVRRPTKLKVHGLTA